MSAFIDMDSDFIRYLLSCKHYENHLMFIATVVDDVVHSLLYEIMGDWKNS